MEIRFPFTEARLHALPLPAPGKRATYYDTKQPGLQLRVTSNGAKTFAVRRRVRGGPPVRVTIGAFPDIPLESREANVISARVKAAQILAQLVGSENPAEARRRLRAELRLGQLFELYIADRKRAGKRSLAALRATWELYLGELPDAKRKKHGKERRKPADGVDWSKHRISQVTTQQISTLHARIVNAGKGTTANRVHELLRAMYGLAVRQKLLQENPAIGITQAQERDRSRFLLSYELPAFFEALEQLKQPWQDFFRVLLHVGYRRSAVAAMRWQDLDLKAGTWTVPHERTKNGEPIVLVVGGPALETLSTRWAARSRPSPWVFPGGGKAGHITLPKKPWENLLKAAGIQDLRMHDLRRTLGSWLAMTGVSLPAIGRALGHKDPRSTQVYARLQAEAVAAAVAVAHEAMRAAGSAKIIPLPIRKKTDG